MVKVHLVATEVVKLSYWVDFKKESHQAVAYHEREHGPDEVSANVKVEFMV